MSVRASSSELSKFDVQPPSLSILGQVKWFDDSAPDANGDIVKTLTSNWAIEAVLVVNNSGGLLTPGTRVLWDVTAAFGVGLAVGVAAGDGVLGAGIVSHLVVSTGVPDDATFWLIRKGPTLVLSDGEAISEGADINVGAAGRMKAAAGTKCGVAGTTLTGSADPDDLFRAFVDFPL